MVENFWEINMPQHAHLYVQQATENKNTASRFIKDYFANGKEIHSRVRLVLDIE